VVGILIYIKGIFFAKFIISTSRVIQRMLIAALLKSPLAWFDVTPTGRILARTTKDQDDLDSSLSFNVQMAAQNLFVLIASVMLISIATPIYLAVAAVSAFVYYHLVRMYLNSSRELKRLEANSRAPLISHFQETVSGINVIRAFETVDSFLHRFSVRQKDYIVSVVNQNISTRWINLMTDCFSVLSIAAAGYLGVVSVVAHLGASSNNFIGLALVWSLQISAVMSFTLRIMADTESNMNAVVRLFDYIDHNPAEKDFENPKPAR
jgi:ABC-type multidrug transport system fused ATPase/permease subunit